MIRTVPLLLATLALLGAGPLLAQAAPAHGAPPLERRWDFSRPAGRAALPDVVVEASGLTFTADRTRLLVHGDERAIISVLDPADGSEVDRFQVGRSPVENDFEGIAAVGERLFLATSRALLVEFRARSGSWSRYRITDTGLGNRCEVEGLEHDPVDDVLLLACRTIAPEGPWALIHRVPMSPWDQRPGPVRISTAELRAFDLPARLRPSGVTPDAAAGTLLVLASRDGLLVEVERDGRIRSVVRLPSDRHPQPEGIAVGPDGTLYVADEADDRDAASLTWYAPAGGAGERDAP